MTKIIVEAPVFCSRKKKIVNYRVAHDEVEALVNGAETRARNGQVLCEQFATLPPEQLPHLLVLYKGKAVVLSTVHESNDDTIKRYLNGALNAEEFEVPPAVTRAERAAAAAIAAEASEG